MPAPRTLSPNDYKITGIDATFEGDEHSADSATGSWAARGASERPRARPPSRSAAALPAAARSSSPPIPPRRSAMRSTRRLARDPAPRSRSAAALLHAVEIDAPRRARAGGRGRRAALERIALRGTWLDEEDVSRLLRLSLPGIDELAALFEIARFGSSRAATT